MLSAGTTDCTGNSVIVGWLLGSLLLLCSPWAQAESWTLRFDAPTPGSTPSGNAATQTDVDAECNGGLAEWERRRWRSSIAELRAAQPDSRPLWVELTSSSEAASSGVPQEPMVLVARGLRLQTWRAWLVESSEDGVNQLRPLPDWLERQTPSFLAIKLPNSSQASAVPPLRVIACLQAGMRPLRILQSIVVMSERALHAAERQLELALAFALGIMMAMGILGGAIYWRLREPAYGIYAAFVVAFMGYLLHILSRWADFFPQSWQSTHVLPLLGLACVGLTAFLGIQFGLKFTRLADCHPQLARWSRLLVLLSCSGCLVSMLGITLNVSELRQAGGWLVNIPMVIAIGLLLPAYARLAWRGNLQARYFVVGWTPLLLAVVWLALSSVGGGFNLVALQVLVAGAASSSVVLGLGLADISWRFRQQRDSALDAASIDGLTGARNRSSFLAQLAVLGGPKNRPGDADNLASALIYCDLDHFKLVNDQHGHAAGDAVLCAFVTLAQRQLRGRDLLGRLGGEEFAVVLPRTTQVQAEEVAERLRGALAAHPLQALDAAIAVTASFGLAMRQPGEAVEHWLARADHALYQAKHGGRNRVVLAS